MGFSLPLSTWLRDPLRDWAEELLSYDSLKDHEYLNKDLVRLIWKEHLEGKKKEPYKYPLEYINVSILDKKEKDN